MPAFIIEKDFLHNQSPFVSKKNTSTGNRILDSIKLIIRNFTDKKQVRTELDDIYKNSKLDEGDTRHFSEAPEFF